MKVLREFKVGPGTRLLDISGTPFNWTIVPVHVDPAPVDFMPTLCGQLFAVPAVCPSEAFITPPQISCIAIQSFITLEIGNRIAAECYRVGRR